MTLRPLPVLFGSALLLTGAFAQANEGPPGTDIHMAKLTKNDRGYWQLADFEQVTRDKGYDNQPYFLPDGSGLLYTKALQMQNGQWQTDSFEYKFANKRQRNLSKSDLSEYSPTLMANGKAYSAIVVEKDGKQYLHKLPYFGTRKSARLHNIEPVGYHAWGKNGQLVMFVLGKPHTLQFMNNTKGKAKVVANDIGRSLRYTLARDAFSFTTKGKDKKWWLSEYQPATDKVTNLVPMPKGSDYYTWIDENTAVTAVGNTLHMWQYKIDKRAGEEDWIPWADVSAACKTKVSRLAVDANQSRLALVCDE